jgi:hypothetical protein
MKAVRWRWRFQARPKTFAGAVGMRLSIFRSIVEAHGGRVWASRAAGPGVTVQFTLPVGESAQRLSCDVKVSNFGQTQARGQFKLSRPEADFEQQERAWIRR